MSGRRDNERRRRSRSPRISKNEDADFQLALKLSAELNGDLGGHAEVAAAAAKRKADYNADVYFAIQAQFDGKGGTKATAYATPYPPDPAASSSTDPGQEASGGTKAVIIETKAPAGRTFWTLTEFTDYLKARQCPGCGDRYFKCESDVSTLFKNWWYGKGALSSNLKCKTCSQSSCIACTLPPDKKRSMAIAGSKTVLWCCSQGRLLLIWLLLCGFDDSYCETKAKIVLEASTAKSKPEFASKVQNTGEGKGKGKSTDEPPAQYSGIGYGGTNDRYWDYSSDPDDDALTFDVLGKPMELKSYKTTGPGRTLSDSKSQAYEAQQTTDRVGTTILGLLQHLLPSLDRGHSFDVSPPVVIPDMLLESKILEYCTDLLRIDAFEEAFHRKPTYDALLDFVRTIGMHYATAKLTVFSTRPRQLELCNLLTQSFHGSQLPLKGRLTSIADSVRDLSTLKETLLKSAEKYPIFSNIKRDQDDLSLCRKVVELWKDLSAYISIPESGPPIPDTPLHSGERGGAISDVTDDRVCGGHTYAKQAKEQFRSAPGRFKRLVFEINVLKTSLPPGIFVRHGESRLDVMKCIIIGPEDTPYENGLFEFDFYCPAEYPNVPPLVSFKGTGGGVSGINPNLYANGKVCLSLLGTWSGEPWKPGVSTLLQVLVSIQAMIFCEQPWFNEPGRERSYRKGQTGIPAEEYNRWLRELTVRLAMIDWLEDPPMMWADVMEQHFKVNADRILRTVIEWCKSASKARGGGLSGNTLPAFSSFMQQFGAGGFGAGGFGAGRHEAGYSVILPKLHQLLQRYGATVTLPDLPKDDDEPQSKKARVDDSRPENLQGPGSQPTPGPLPGWGVGINSYEAQHEIFLSRVVEQYGTIPPPVPAGRGGWSPSNFSSHSFHGHGQTLGTGPDDPPPTTSSESERGGGRGRGRGFGGGLSHGAAQAEQSSLRDSLRESKDGTGRKLGDGIDKPDRGGRSGRGGRGGGGSSKA